MNLASVAATNILRNRLRAALTVIGVAVAVLAFVLLRTIAWAWTVQSEESEVDRIVTRHKVTFVINLPKRYAQDILDLKDEKGAPLVKAVTWSNWFGGKDPNHKHDEFFTIAVDPKTYLDVYDEVEVPKEQAEEWKADRRNMIAGEKLAKKLGWEVGNEYTLVSQIYPGEHRFKLVGVYKAKARSVDPNQVFFHWNYLNDLFRDSRKEQIGWITTRVARPGTAALVSKKIDEMFEERDIQTLSQDEQSFQRSFLAMFDAILTALSLVSLVILAIMMLILGNTIAMAVRERTGEYAVLRAIGFLPRHLLALVLFEAGTLGLVGGIGGLGFAYVVVDKMLGRVIEENFGSMFPFFQVPKSVMAIAIGLSVGLAVLAAAIPAIQAYRIRVIEALRRVA